MNWISFILGIGRSKSLKACWLIWEESEGKGTEYLQKTNIEHNMYMLQKLYYEHLNHIDSKHVYR